MLFRSHYNHYDFLYSLSDQIQENGLEHHQSSEDGSDPDALTEWAKTAYDRDLLAHEFTHSWNGKYRRPDKLYQKDFATPQQGELLWVYEGMTEYLGNVLATRSGLRSQAAYRDMLALTAAQQDYRSGREWRSTDDTAISSSILRGKSPAWTNWRRTQDY